MIRSYFLLYKHRVNQCICYLYLINKSMSHIMMHVIIFFFLTDLICRVILCCSEAFLFLFYLLSFGISCTVLLLLSCFPSAPLELEHGTFVSLWVIKPTALVLLIKREVSALHFVPPGTQFSNHTKLFYPGQKTPGKVDRGRLGPGGVEPSLSSRFGWLRIWHPDIAALTQPAHPHQMSYHSFSHSLPWKPHCLPDILKLQKDVDSFFQVLSHRAHI